jgi:hypothetical protein
MDINEFEKLIKKEKNRYENKLNLEKIAYANKIKSGLGKKINNIESYYKKPPSLFQTILNNLKKIFLGS